MLGTEPPQAPYARVVGQILTPDDMRPAGDVTVVFTYSPYVVSYGTAYIERRVEVGVDPSGALYDPARGKSYVDLIAPGAGVTPAGQWLWHIDVVASGDYLLQGDLALRQGTVVDIASVLTNGDGMLANPFARQRPAAGGAGAADPALPGPTPPAGDLAGLTARVENLTQVLNGLKTEIADNKRAIDELKAQPPGGGDGNEVEMIDNGDGTVTYKDKTVPQGTPEG